MPFLDVWTHYSHRSKVIYLGLIVGSSTRKSMRSKNCSATSSSDDKTSSWIFQAEGEERVERRHWRLKGQKDLNGIGGTSPT
jgi:hypothetical protein